MANEVIDHKTRIRQRHDNTALHKTKQLDASPDNIDIVRLDIVATKVTVEVPNGLTVTVEGSVDGKAFFAMFAGLTNSRDTYGDAAGEHLVKVVKFTRTAGSGQATVVAV